MEIANKKYFCDAITEAGPKSITGEKGEIHVAFDCIVKGEEVQFTSKTAFNATPMQLATAIFSLIKTEIDYPERVQLALLTLFEAEINGAKMTQFKFTDKEVKQEGFEEALENLMKAEGIVK